ncbi:unnamed protein product [Merluccius merluccius]
MGGLPVVLLLCSFHEARETSDITLPTMTPACREQKYPCTRMYSVHRPMKKCVGSMCFYSVPRVYIINKEICTRILCDDDEFLQGSYPDGRGAFRGQRIRNTVRIAVATSKPGQTRPDGANMVAYTTGP